MPLTGRRAAQMSWAFTANDYESARRARREFTSYIKRCNRSLDAVHESELIFGELIGNAVRHVGGEVCAKLNMQGTQPVLCVTDCEPQSDLTIPERGPESETGRGLLIVHALARRVWVERSPRTKTVCAVLPCDLPLQASVERGEVSA